MGLSILSKSRSVLSIAGLRSVDDGVDGYGFYAKGTTGFVKLKNHPSSRVDYANYESLPFVNRIDNELELLVYQKDFNQDSVNFYSCTMGLKGRFEKLDVIFNKVGRNKHQITFITPVHSTDWLFVQHSESFQKEVGVIALSYPPKQLVKIFSDMTKQAKVILPSLQKALQSYPESGALKNLLPLWERKDANLRDNKCFGLCEEQWEFYTYAENKTSKQHYLKRTKQFLVGYLRKFPEGLHALEANSRIKLVETKLVA